MTLMGRFAIVTAVLFTFVFAPADASAKRKKQVEEEAPPEPVPATFQVHGTFFQDLTVFEYGEQVECDLHVYLVEDGQPVTDATVQVGEITMSADSLVAGRYQVKQQCVDPGTVLPIHITRANQFWDGESTMIGYPTITAPAMAEEVPVSGDLVVRWEPAEGAVRYRVELDGVREQWVVDGTEATIPKEQVPPYQHHRMTVTAYGTDVDPEAAAPAVSGGGKTWAGFNPVTRVRTEFDFGPGLMGQPWTGPAVMQWWEDEKTLDEDLFQLWLSLEGGGGYVLKRVKIAAYENGVLDGREIAWEIFDMGTYSIGEGGSLTLQSGENEHGWKADYADPTITLVRVWADTDDADELKRRRYQGKPKPWPLEIGVVEPVDF